MAINFDSDTNQVSVSVPDPISVTVTEKGVAGPQGEKGDTGDQGVQGEQGTQGIAGPIGPGVPAGGVEGQALFKSSETDYDSSWDYVESVYLQIQNDEGSTLSAGSPVYAKGVSGSSILVGKADANDAAKMPSIGILLKKQ